MHTAERKREISHRSMVFCVPYLYRFVKENGRCVGRVPAAPGIYRLEKLRLLTPTCGHYEQCPRCNMVRWITMIGMSALLMSAWVLFEIENIWPFNIDRAEVLRSMFALGVIATIGAFAFGRSRLLPPTMIASAFVGTTMYSYALVTAAYIVSVAVIVALVGALGCVARRPLYFR